MFTTNNLQGPGTPSAATIQYQTPGGGQNATIKVEQATQKPGELPTFCYTNVNVSEFGLLNGLVIIDN